MSQTRGEEHDFIGMHIKFKDKKIEISMKSHIIKAINLFHDDITKNASTPAGNFLFNIRESPTVSKERADNFHSVVNKYKSICLVSPFVRENGKERNKRKERH